MSIKQGRNIPGDESNCQNRRTSVPSSLVHYAQRGSAGKALPLPRGQEERATNLSRVSVRNGFGFAGGQDNGANIGGEATVGSACSQGFRPHLLVGQTMRAYHPRGGEFARELLHLSQRSQFKIH